MAFANSIEKEMITHLKQKIKVLLEKHVKKTQFYKKDGKFHYNIINKIIKLKWNIFCSTCVFKSINL